VSASLPAHINGHVHPLSELELCGSAPPSADAGSPPGWPKRTDPFLLMISATQARCHACQTVVAQWIVHHSDPLTITALAHRVVRGAVQLRQVISQQSGKHPKLQALLEHAFGSEVAPALHQIGATRDPAAAAGTFTTLAPTLRIEVVRSIFEGLARPAQAAAAIITETNPQRPGGDPDAIHRDN